MVSGYCRRCICAVLVWVAVVAVSAVLFVLLVCGSIVLVLALVVSYVLRCMLPTFWNILVSVVLVVSLLRHYQSLRYVNIQFPWQSPF